MSKKKHNYRFVITKYKKKYLYFDMDELEISGMTVDNVYDGYRVTKNNEVYIKYSYQELEDYYCDIGSCYKDNKGESYKGRLILETSDKELFINIFYSLIGEKPKIQELW